MRAVRSLEASGFRERREPSASRAPSPMRWLEPAPGIGGQWAAIEVRHQPYDLLTPPAPLAQDRTGVWRRVLVPECVGERLGLGRRQRDECPGAQSTPSPFPRLPRCRARFGVHRTRRPAYRDNGAGAGPRRVDARSQSACNLRCDQPTVQPHHCLLLLRVRKVRRRPPSHPLSTRRLRQFLNQKTGDRRVDVSGQGRRLHHSRRGLERNCVF